MPEVYDILKNISVFSAMLAIGITLLYGTWRKWTLLVNPPAWSGFLSSHAALKNMFGPKTLLYYLYFLGILVSGIAIIVLVRNIRLLGKGLGYWS